jgi:NAD(P)H-nitrite reductase large subunit
MLRDNALDMDIQSKPVRRCVCFSTTFEELLEADVRSIDEIQERFRCGTKCGTCVPYLKKMLDTGETAFAVIDWEVPALAKRGGAP